jgi:hypothetical protein
MTDREDWSEGWAYRDTVAARKQNIDTLGRQKNARGSRLYGPGVVKADKPKPEGEVPRDI